MHRNNLIHFMSKEVCRAGWDSYYHYNGRQIRNPALHRLNNTFKHVSLPFSGFLYEYKCVISNATSYVFDVIFGRIYVDVHRVVHGRHHGHVDARATW